jgi:K+-transporting ATPase KdpF subunit
VTAVWMMWLAGASTVILLAYLVYALLRAENLE